MRLTDYHVVGIKRQLKPNTSPPRPIIKAEIKQLVVIHMTFGRTSIIEQDLPGRSMDCEDVPQHMTIAIYSDMTSLVMHGTNTAEGLHRPDIEAPCTLIASPMKSWNMNSQKGSNP